MHGASLPQMAVYASDTEVNSKFVTPASNRCQQVKLMPPFCDAAVSSLSLDVI